MATTKQELSLFPLPTQIFNLFGKIEILTFKETLQLFEAKI